MEYFLQVCDSGRGCGCGGPAPDSVHVSENRAVPSALMQTLSDLFGTLEKVNFKFAKMNHKAALW